MNKNIELPKKFIIMGFKDLSKDKFEPIKNRMMFVKPDGGLWASPYTPNSKYVSAWHRWCDGNMGDKMSNDAIIFTLKKDARCFCIDGQDDLQVLIDIVGEQESPISMPFKIGSYIDFEKAKEKFDAIYLTEGGRWRTHLPLERHYLNLYTWDVESILVMNFDCIESWEYKKLDV
jgi:hypothetical protein